MTNFLKSVLLGMSCLLMLTANAVGDEDGATVAKRVPIPKTVLQKIMQEVPPEAQQQLSSDNLTFKGYAADLNADGQNELIVEADNIYHCGSGGCAIWGFQRQAGQDRLILEGFGTPNISQNKTAGYYDIVLVASSSAYDEAYITYQWQAKGANYKKTACFRIETDRYTLKKRRLDCQIIPTST